MDTKAAAILGVCVIVGALIVALVPRSLPTAPPADVGQYVFVRSNGTNCFVLDTKMGRHRQR